MAEIVPFRGVRFAPRGGRELSDLLAPPYDLVSRELRAALLARDPHNVAHLSTGAPGAGPDAFQGVAERWRSWLDQGVLRRDPAPALYPLEQSFWAPDGRHVRRRGFLAAVRLHELEEGVIIPHERTHEAQRAERLELLRATGVNFSPLLGLYADERGAVADALAEATAVQPSAAADTDDGVHVRLWVADRPEVMARLATLVEDQRILLADGHHRYATALAYRRELSAAHPGLSQEGGHHYVLMFLCSLSDPGLVVFPVHRLLSDLPGFSLGALLERLPAWFRVETLDEDVRRPAGRAWAISRLAEHGGRSTAFLMITAQDRRARILTLRDDADLDAAGVPSGETARMIDVNVLHGLVLEHLLGIPGAALERQEHLCYVRDAEEAVSRVLSGEHPLGFLVNPAPMWQVRMAAEEGRTLPPRATLFRPVLPAGLVMREVDPQAPA